MANIYKEIGGLYFQLAVPIEKLAKFADLILASQAQPTPRQGEVREEFVIPKLGGGIYKHEKLGELYNSIQAYSYAERYCKHFSANLAKPQPTRQAAADAGALIIERAVKELGAYNPQADQYKGEHIHKYWAKTLSGALDAMKESK